MSHAKKLVEDLKKSISGLTLTEGFSCETEILRLIDNSKAKILAWDGKIDEARRSLKNEMERALDCANVMDEVERLSLKKKVWPKALMGTRLDLQDRIKTEKLGPVRAKKVMALCEASGIPDTGIDFNKYIDRRELYNIIEKAVFKYAADHVMPAAERELGLKLDQDTYQDAVTAVGEMVVELGTDPWAKSRKAMTESTDARYEFDVEISGRGWSFVPAGENPAEYLKDMAATFAGNKLSGTKVEVTDIKKK